jgi:hypothetical protein
MNVAPTLEGGIRIEAENAIDWSLLEAITHDARGGGDLASRLGALMGEDPHAADWEEFVIPDLHRDFAEQLEYVAAAVKEARAKAGGGAAAGPLWIHRSDAMHWYGSLNQARLALEARHHFGDRTRLPAGERDEQRRSAFFRNQFYQAIQSLLLDFVLK